MTPRWPGTVDTLALAAAFLDSILSPMAAIALAFGPMKTMPAFASAQERPHARTESRSLDAPPRRRSLAGRDDFLDSEIAFGRRRRADRHGLVRHLHVKRVAVGLGIDRDRLDAQAARGLDDPAGDLAAIGDQDTLEHAGLNPPSRDPFSSSVANPMLPGPDAAKPFQARHLFGISAPYDRTQMTYIDPRSLPGPGTAC